MADLPGVRPAPAARKAQKEIRRQQLIEATIDTLASKGYSDTTLAEVARRAGFSTGIVNSHFDSKERLLLETLRYLSDEYRKAWQTAINRAGPDPARQLAAIVEVDFDRKICTRRKLAAWYAFWGEAKARPDYLKHWGAVDEAFQDAIETLCARIIGDAGYDQDSLHVARGLDALLEGLWVKLLTGFRSFTREQARSIAFSWLAQVFPKHFDANGLAGGMVEAT